MAEETVVVRIRTIDEATAGFLNQIKNLQSLANAANSVDRILSTVVNTQLRLENAQERVLNSQDRLISATEKLNELANDENATLKDQVRAQQDVEHAQRGVTISTNNLERAQGQLLGTEIMVGIETLKLIQSLPALVNIFTELEAAARGVAVAETLMASAANPIVGILSLVGIAVGGYAIQQISLAGTIDKTTEAQVGLRLELNDRMGYNTAIKAIQDYLIQLALMSDPVKNAIQQLNDLKYWQDLTGATPGTKLDYGPKVNVTASDYGASFASYIGEQQTNSSTSTSTNSSKNSSGPAAGQYYNGKLVRAFDDFIQRPGQAATNFSAQDTIIGVKDPSTLGGGGMTIVINGDNYGIDAEQISKALMDSIRKKVGSF